jgi:hypothetical protein
MSSNYINPADIQAAVDALAKHGSIQGAARHLGIAYTTFRGRLHIAKVRGVKASPLIEPANDPDLLRLQIKRLERELKEASKVQFDHAVIKDKILTLEKNVSDVDMPKWMLQAAKGHDFPGTPTLTLSDLHWGEVVDPSQVGGVNEFNMSIARRRLKDVAASTIRLLEILSPQFKYPGLVLNLGGDLVNGNLREEMTATNEENIMPTLIDVFDSIGSFIETMVEKFGKVFIPCVAGNHGRSTIKTWSSDRHATSFEWLIYCLLAKRFAADSRITFLIPNGVDARYRIYHHRFLLNHGDAFRGGDGVIGVLGPVIRGDYKKRARNSQINQDYDTMIIGHFHQYVHLSKLIINGSLIGYNEYAYINNFPFEPPCQALFLTHPKFGITYRMPVYAAKREVKEKLDWVSIGK